MDHPITQEQRKELLLEQFSEQTRALGLEEIAKDCGQPLKSHTEIILASILSADDRMEAVKELVRKLAPANIPVLILGKTGVGKELIAQALHGDRKPASFVPINCGAIPAELLESELFGAKKGGYTGAIDKMGLIELADKGTLFLDEIGDMPPLLQCKLLRVLQDKKYRRVGDNDQRSVSFRLVSATNHLDLKTKDNFRSDLYYRLAGTTIRVPTLKERGVADLYLIAEKFARTPEIAELAVVKAEESALEGNVRELLNIIEEMNVTLT
jgi:two-component system, NtrC family, response regulator PilR